MEKGKSIKGTCFDGNMNIFYFRICFVPSKEMGIFSMLMLQETPYTHYRIIKSMKVVVV